eukprot:13548239-Ditylum_brightwellii.AAC.1
MVSDGSSDDEENIMTFGWKIVDENKDPLVEHSGPALGKATSFCAEGHGLLSLAQCLHHGKTYTQTKIQCYIEINIDNEAQVAVTLGSYGSRLTIFHVKSHQDNDKDEEDLDLPARLNVADGNLATIFHIQYGQPLPLVPQ